MEFIETKKITNDIANGNMKKNTFKKNKNFNSGKSVMEYFKSNVETSSESGEDDINENGAEIKPKPKPKGRCWSGYKPTPGKKAYSKGSCMKG